MQGFARQVYSTLKYTKTYDIKSYQQPKILKFNIFVDNLIFIRIFAAPKLWGNEHKLFINKHLCLQFNN